MMSESPTHPTLQDLVREYYEDNALPKSALRQLMAEAAEPRPRLMTARHRAIAAGIAATLAVVVLGLGVMRREAVPSIGAGDVAVTGPRLVAVQIHADWCERSPQVAPIFADLLTAYGNQPVLFVTLDITDDVRREQAKLLSSTLGIPEVFEEPFESGMIKLIDRESHTLLAAITGREQASELEVRIAEVLDVADDGEREGEGGGV